MSNFIPRSLAPFERYPNELATDRVKLGQLLDHHTTLSTRFIGAGGGTLWPTDIFIFGVALRSFHLVEGFIQAFDSWNVTVAVPIIRMQIDSLVRIAYVAQAPDCDELAMALMRGEQLRKMKTYDDPTRNAYDGELVERAGRIYSWLPPVSSLTRRSLAPIPTSAASSCGSPFRSRDSRSRSWMSSSVRCSRPRVHCSGGSSSGRSTRTKSATARQETMSRTPTSHSCADQVASSIASISHDWNTKPPTSKQSVIL